MIVQIHTYSQQNTKFKTRITWHSLQEESQCIFKAIFLRSIFTFHGPRFTLGEIAYYVINKKTAYTSIA